MQFSDVAVVLLTVLVGFGAGVLSALLGVGGAVITTPAVRLLGATPIEAVGSTVPAILPGAVSGTLRYAREGLVEWRVALSLGVAGSVFALGGALASARVDGRLLMVLTAVLMLWSGISVARGGRRAAGPPTEAAVLVAPAEAAGVDELLEGVEASETDTALAADPRAEGPGARRPLVLLALVGALSGFVAGLLGVGGGIVMVPVMTGPLRIPMRSAVASSLVAVAIFSVPALVTHAVLGHIDWLFALPLMVGVVPGARVGAHITIGASDRTIRLAFGVLIVVVAMIYGGTEAAALLSGS